MQWVVWAIILGSLLAWVVAFDRFLRGLPVLAWDRERHRPRWSWREILVVGACEMLCAAIAQGIAVRWFDLPAGPFTLEALPVERQVIAILAMSTGFLVGLLLAVFLLTLLRHTTAADWGWSGRHLLADLGLGATTFLMLVVPMFLIHWLALTLWPTEQRHPFFEILQAKRFEHLATIGFAALIVAPLLEETLFRVLFQGWLQAMLERPTEPPAPVSSAPAGEAAIPLGEARSSEEAIECLAPPTVPTSADRPVEAVVEEVVVEEVVVEEVVVEEVVVEEVVVEEVVVEEVVVEEVVVEEVVVEEVVVEEVVVERPLRGWRAWSPIVTSSLVFAAMHRGQGVAPFPLFFLALGLGYLYQRTGRIAPSVTVHFLVNALAIAQGVLVAGRP